ncbi:MAG: hypothetical protein ACE5HS_13740 [bacterium]
MINHRAWSFLVRPMIYVFVAISAIFTRCTFDPSGLPPDAFPPVDVPLAEQLCRQQPVKILEDPGKIVVYHGFGCAESNQDGAENILRVEQSIRLPEYVTAATVFLNGWELQYLYKDRHVYALGTSIFDIAFRNGTLSWQAAGGLSDDNFDDGYRWQYYYTVIAWNELETAALVDHDDDNKIFKNTNQNHTTALKVISGYIQNNDFAAGDAIAILPRGHIFAWKNRDDHHLLQLAYNLDHSERFIQYEKDYMASTQPSLPTPASQVGNGFVSWESKAIFKDDALRRDYHVGEMVSAFGGRDVGLVQPPFTILPEEDAGFFSSCLSLGPTGITTEEHVIENVPFEYAVPILSGWDMSYACDDEHITQIGVWLSDFSYDKAPEDPTGTLRYTLSSVFHDKDNNPGHEFIGQVQILGLKPIVSTGVPTAVIDSPQTGVEVAPDTAITLSGEGVDPEDGALAGNALSWYSDRDGFLGYGKSITVALSGPAEPCNPEYVWHTITLRAADKDGHQTSRQIIIRVGYIC